MITDEAILVSVNKASAMISLSRPTLYKLMNSGAIHAVKSGGRTLIPVQSLRDYAASLATYSATNGPGEE